MPTTYAVLWGPTDHSSVCQMAAHFGYGHLGPEGYGVKAHDADTVADEIDLLADESTMQEAAPVVCPATQRVAIDHTLIVLPTP